VVIFEHPNPLTRLGLELAAVRDSGLLPRALVLVLGISSLQALDNPHRLLVGNLAENDVLAIEPRGDDSGDEELRAVAVP
jgi:hypothetical protein